MCAELSRSEQGFSVVDVLVAMVILTMTLAMATELVETVLWSDQGARACIAASDVALQKAEEFRRMGGKWWDEVGEKGKRGEVIRGKIHLEWTAKRGEVKEPGTSGLGLLTIDVKERSPMTSPGDEAVGRRPPRSQTFSTLLRRG